MTCRKFFPAPAFPNTLRLELLPSCQNVVPLGVAKLLDVHLGKLLLQEVVQASELAFPLRTAGGRTWEEAAKLAVGPGTMPTCVSERFGEPVLGAAAFAVTGSRTPWT